MTLLVNFPLTRMKNFLAEILATFFYVGRAPKAPGTFGSLAALPFAWWLWALPSFWAWTLIAVIFGVGCWAAENVIRRTGTQDHQSIVLDEAVGIFVTASIVERTYVAYLCAFLVFRFFDILKPPPIRWVDRKVKGGFGTMLDDLVAALIGVGMIWAWKLTLGKAA